MSKYIRFQLITLLKTPTIYLIVFIFTPMLFVFSSAFLPAHIVLPGILVFEMCSIVFFCVGIRTFQTDSTTFAKRLNVIGISKFKVIFSNALIAIITSVLSVYILMEIFATTAIVRNWELSKLDTSQMLYSTSVAEGFVFDSTIISSFWELSRYPKTFFEISFNWFFINDMFSTLDDGIYLLILDELSKVSDLDHLESLVEKLIDSDLTDKGVEIILGLFIENWIIPHRDDWTMFIETQYNLFLENGHAPINILSGLWSDSYEATDGTGIWIEDGVVNYSSLYEYLPQTVESKEHLDYYQNVLGYSDIQTVNAIFYTRLVPTIRVFINDGISFRTILFSSGDNTTGYGTLLAIWLQTFTMFVIISISLYAISLFINTVSRTYEQNFALSGTVVFIILLFSGVLIPFGVYLSTEITFATLIFMPTTLPLLMMNGFVSHGFISTSVLQEPAMLSCYVYPLFLSFILFVISYKLLHKENKSLIKYKNSDSMSKGASITNLVISSLLLLLTFLLMYGAIKSRTNYLDGDETLTNTYISNEILFGIQTLMLIYLVLTIMNWMDLNNYSNLLLNQRWIVSVFNLIFMFPFAIFTTPFQIIGHKTSMGN